MEAIDIFDMPKPLVDEPQALMPHRIFYPTAIVMPTDDDMLDFQHFYGILQHA
jgi:hypothetical protein